MEIDGHRPKRGSGRTKKQLTVTSLKALQETADIFSKELTDSDLKVWGGILSEFGQPAIEWAFDNWNRNGAFFPKPTEILQLIHTFGGSSENQVKLCGLCHDGFVISNPNAKPSDYIMHRCPCLQAAIAAAKVAVKAVYRSRYGRGYHGNDLMWLWKERQKSKGPWTEAMYYAALDRLDKIRSGGAPEWRR
jgi:hypothetical protein